MWVMTPGPCSSSSTWVSPGGNAEVVPVALFVEVAARFGLGIELLLAAAAHLADAHGGGGAHGAAFLRFGQVIHEARLGPKPAFPSRVAAELFVSYTA